MLIEIIKNSGNYRQSNKRMHFNCSLLRGFIHGACMTDTFMEKMYSLIY